MKSEQINLQYLITINWKSIYLDILEYHVNCTSHFKTYAKLSEAITLS